MHRKHIAAGKKKIHHAKNGFLDLAGVRGSTDQHGAAAEADQNESSGVGAVTQRISVEVGDGNHRELGLVIVQILLSRSEKELTGKQCMPRKFGDHPNRQAILWIGAGKEILNVEFAIAQVLQAAIVKRIKLVRIEWLIHRAPVDLVCGNVVLDGELVLWRAPGPPRVSYQGTIARQPRLVAADSVLHQHRRRQVSMDL